MEVLVGPTFAIDVAASPAPAPAPAPAYAPKEKISSSSLLFIKEDEVGGGSDPRSPDLSSDSSSSIGSPGESDVEEEDGVVSSAGIGGLTSLACMEDSLPIKRGLSNHYAGKSKSFANLSDVSSVKELPKVESLFNKRRRLLLANKLSRSRKSSFYSWQNPNSMPLLALVEDDEDTEQAPSSSDDKTASIKPKLQQSNLRASFKSQSCFSLTDLHLLQAEEEHQ